MAVAPEFQKTIFTWNIKNFNQILTTKNELHSPEFPSEGNVCDDWSIVLNWSRRIFCGTCTTYHNLVCEECHQEHCKGDVSIHLSFPRISQNLPPLKVKYILQNSSSDKHYKKSTVFCVQGEEFSQSGFRDFITLKRIKDYIVDKDLTIICSIKQASKPLSTGFECFMSKTSLSDVEFHIGGQVFPAHKVIMSSKSPVFRQMFAHQLKENINNVVNIVDIESNVFYELLWFMYSGKVRKLNEHACSLLIAADKYDVNSLKTICEIYLHKNLTSENVVKILKLADKLNSFSLRDNCYTFIKCNFKEVVTSEEFKTLGDCIPLLMKIAEDYFVDSWTSKKVVDSCENNNQAEQKNDGYETFLNQEIWSDVEIHNNGKIYNAHKLILSAKSAVFRTMLVDLEGHAKIEIKDIDPLVFYQLLRFIYTGFVENLEDMTYELLLAADKYQISSLKTVCEQALILKVNCENVVSMLKIGENRKADKLKERCFLFLIRKLISGTLGMDVFKQLSKTHPQLVLELLITTGIKCEEEE
ncbi:speckle-type POZ protein-like [Leptopilina heterotoma]|uniref:speckle-type POZ protein-like n=1 Tax=Leptopilina heterotoma TaxID=63436 RepID=UPI001CA8ACE4|nr:speckle-type POZ protein-like [Leptopilina heterotoma]